MILQLVGFPFKVVMDTALEVATWNEMDGSQTITKQSRLSRIRCPTHPVAAKRRGLKQPDIHLERCPC